MNENQILVMIGENLLLVDKLYESEYIGSELYRNKMYYVYTLYMFGIYNEEDDSLMTWQVIKV